MTSPTPAQRLAARERPSGRPVMAQSWRHLLFAHWTADPAVIQRTLPPGLTVDVWEGRAYVGLVPFYMRRVRPIALPSMPWISNFLELNVRTYVHDRHGNPGVWFYSLDCNQPFAVLLARQQFSLPYFHARMASRRTHAGAITYHSRRRTAPAQANFSWTSLAPQSSQSPSTESPTHAQPGTLDFFLLERYYLFTSHRAQIYRGQVHHTPYPLLPVASLTLNATGFLPASPDYRTPPIHLISSPGVDVEVFNLDTV
jgi:uncharacterized protein YqjF (DUF2071 family)